jgi:membrane-bound metal-dependent hydrolase YbcI (DUF457 family)
MPFTPYHFGPSGFVGLVFRKWLDIPVFVLANVVVDIEVLFFDRWPIHRYAHTLLIGAAVGAMWGMAAYPLRNLFRKIMRLFRLPYETSLRKMVLSGVLGVWLHVLIDSVYHFDVRPFWPNKTISLWRMARTYISQGQIEIICVAFFIAAIILYVIVVRGRIRKK